MSRRVTIISVSISLSSGFSFQGSGSGGVYPPLGVVSISLSSGFSFQVLQSILQRVRFLFRVSISLSSGFSFQGKEYTVLHGGPFSGFNLVIERLLISGVDLLIFRQTTGWHCFNLVIERLLISGPSPQSS